MQGRQGGCVGFPVVIASLFGGVPGDTPPFVRGLLAVFEALEELGVAACKREQAAADEQVLDVCPRVEDIAR